MKISSPVGRLMPVLCLLALVTTLSLSTANRKVAAGTFSCALPSQCNEDATCSGDYYSRSGCSITCYRQVPNGGGLIESTSSATCSRVRSGPGGTLE